MTNRKIILLLVSLLLLVNYINYVLPDRDEMEKHILLLQKKIIKEQKLSQMHIAPESLKTKAKTLFFDGRIYNYSKTMNTLQRLVSDAAKDTCKVTNIKWAQAPVSDTWYETLKLDLRMECSPKNLFLFFNNLRNNPKLLTTTDLRIVKARGRSRLRISVKVKAYKLKVQHEKS